MGELVEICRHESENYWRVISNSKWDSSVQEGLAKRLLENPYNDYAEYKNCSVIHRIIRKKDLYKYGLSEANL